jgi:DNA-binding response OmpR family regulator
MPTPSVAVVDDEENIRNTLEFALHKEGYEVHTFREGLEAWKYLRDRLPDVVVLDIILPGLDGLELCRRLRSLSDTLPIIFLTSKDEEIDRVVGLEIGADDYLCKPFSIRELVARIRVLLRRSELIQRAAQQEPDSVVELGHLRLDLDRFRAYWDGNLIPLTLTEFRILHALARRPGHVKTRAELLQDGYLQDSYVSERTIDSHIKRLRKKLSVAGAEPSIIETVHGLGYRFCEL